MKTLSNSSLFNIMDSSENIKLKLNNVNIDPYIPMMNRMLDIIKRKYKYPSTTKIINAINEGRVIPYFNPDSASPITQLLPCWAIQKNKNVVAVVNLSHYKFTIDSDGELDGDVRTLFAMLQGGLFLQGYYRNNKEIVTNGKFIRSAMHTYVSLFLKILDRLYAIKLIEERENLIKYLIAKFFLINFIEKTPNENTNNLAFIVTDGKNEEMIKSFDKDIDQDKIYNNLPDFLFYLRDSERMFKKLDVRTFIRSWISVYHSNTTLSLELLPYFMWVIGTSVVGSNIVKAFIIQNVAVKTMNIAFNEYIGSIK